MSEPTYASDEVEECLHKSIAADETVGAVVPAAQTRYHLARNLAYKDEKAKSMKLLTKLSDQFDNWDIQVWKEKCSEALSAFD